MNTLAAIYDKLFILYGYELLEKISGRSSFRVFRNLREFDFLDTHSREIKIREGIEMLLSCAYNTEYYGIYKWSGPAFNSFDNAFKRIPITSKACLKKYNHSMINNDHKGKYNKIQTAGSTGMPLKAYADAISATTLVAGMLYGRSWWGILPGERSVNVWGHSKYLSHGFKNKVRLAKRRLLDRIMNRYVFPAYDLSGDNIRKFISKCFKFKPAYLVGYSSSMYQIADYINRNKSAFPSIKGIVVTGEVLYDWQEEIIKKALKAPVIREYGLCEAGVIAYSCPKGNMHVMDGFVYVEILNEYDQPVRQGEVGRIIITPYRTRKVPLIRYDTGDLAEYRGYGCECGLPSMTIGNIIGRAYDTIRTKSNNVISSVLFTHAMKYLDEVEVYQVIQKRLGEVEIHYESEKPLTFESKEIVIQKIKENTDGNIDIQFCHKDKIEREKSGKYRWIKSEIKENDL